MRRAAITFLIAALVVSAALLVAQDQETMRVKSEIAAEDPRDPSYVAALVGAALTRGNRYEVLTNGDRIFPAMLGAIDTARRRINFETYVYDSGDLANRFTDALERAAKRGVRVTTIVDAVGASAMDRSHVERLRSAGVRVLTFNPTRWYTPENLNFRTHRKILVVDGEVAFTGGAGVADHWLGNARTAEEWRDTHVRIHGPIVRLLEAAFYENALESQGPIVPELDDTPATVDEEGASLVVRSSPSGGSTDLKRLYLQAIASARQTIDLTSPYFVTDESTMWALEDAVRRGVRVRVLVEGDITDAMPVKYASRQAYDALLSLGIHIYEYRPTMMHTKTLVVDGILSIFGSANFDNRSLELNDELNVAVWSRELGARFTSDLEQDLKASERIELDKWRSRSLLQKSREHFWSYFGEVF
ncbi:MAG TPA: phospholipase D-like domain-containing protein [Vicinamibacterales bacterium]